MSWPPTDMACAGTRELHPAVLWEQGPFGHPSAEMGAKRELMACFAPCAVDRDAQSTAGRSIRREATLGVTLEVLACRRCAGDDAEDDTVAVFRVRRWAVGRPVLWKQGKILQTSNTDVLPCLCRGGYLGARGAGVDPGALALQGAGARRGHIDGVDGDALLGDAHGGERGLGVVGGARKDALPDRGVRRQGRRRITSPRRSPASKTSRGSDPSRRPSR